MAGGRAGGGGESGGRGLGPRAPGPRGKLRGGGAPLHTTHPPPPHASSQPTHPPTHPSPPGMDLVVHVATAAPTAANALKRDLMRAVNVDGTRHVLDACVAAGVPRLVYTSSASVVFDGRDLHDVDEAQPYASADADYYTLTKIEGGWRERGGWWWRGGGGGGGVGGWGCVLRACASPPPARPCLSALPPPPHTHAPPPPPPTHPPPRREAGAGCQRARRPGHRCPAPQRRVWRVRHILSPHHCSKRAKGTLETGRLARWLGACGPLPPPPSARPPHPPRSLPPRAS